MTYSKLANLLTKRELFNKNRRVFGVATVAIGDAGARNAAHLAMAILALSDPAARDKLVKRREANRAPK